MPITPIPAMPSAPAPTDDRATFTAKSFAYFEALPGTTDAMNVLGGQVEDLAEQVDIDAAQVAADRVVVDTNTALVANYAGAAPWATGTYALGVVVYSTVNQRLYRKITASSATVTDPSADGVNWALVNAMVPFSAVTTNTQQAVNGGRYSLQRTTTEGSGTNLLTYSEQFDNAAWTKSNVTITANSTTSPDGTTTADTLTTNAGALPGAYQVVTVSPSSTNDYYGSVMVKKNTSSKVKLDFYYSGNTQSPLLFDFDTQVISGGAYPGEYIAEFQGDGWWRLGYRVLRDASASKTALIILVSSNSGVVGQSIFVWGAQVEAGNAPTSYMQSGAAQGTRASGQVPPQRVIFPASPASNAYVAVQIANGIETNVIDPNGSTIENNAGPALLDFPTGSIEFQYLNNTWRAV